MCRHGQNVVACSGCSFIFWVNSIFTTRTIQTLYLLQFNPIYTHHMRHHQCAFSAFGNFDNDNYNKSRPSARSLGLLFPVNITVMPTLIAITLPNLERGTLSYCQNLHSLMSRPAVYPSLMIFLLKLVWLLINLPLTNIMDIVAFTSPNKCNII